MDAGAIAGLIAAGAFVVLVLLVAVPLLKLGRTLDEATLAIRKTHEGAAPLLDQARATVANVNDTVSTVNTQLGQVDEITKGVGSITSNAAAVTSVVSSTIANPLIKVAAFTYGVRSTVSKKQDAAILADAKRARRGRKG